MQTKLVVNYGTLIQIWQKSATEDWGKRPGCDLTDQVWCFGVAW